MTATAPARTRWAAARRVRPGGTTQLVVNLVAGAAWVALVVLGGDAGHAGHSSTPAPAPAPAAPGLGPALAGLPAWLLGYGLMVVAMMWPRAALAAALVARSSFPSRRLLNVGVLLTVTTLLWLAFGGVLYPVTLLLGPATAVWWPVLWLVVALAVTWLPRRARLLWTCLRLPPIYPGGRRGLSTTAYAGWVFWRRCAWLCGPVMAAMVAHHGLVVMALASLAVWWEQWHPRARQDQVPRALLGGALLAIVLALP